jgi:hypothetical protein
MQVVLLASQHADWNAVWLLQNVPGIDVSILQIHEACQVM